MKRSGFTMIELIFVIVILGILAAVAIPKLAATRDDAKTSSELTNLATCISDTGSAFTATGTENNASAACENLVCFSVKTIATGHATGTATDGNITAINTADTSAYCVDAQAKALDKNLSSSGGFHHLFGGAKVTF